MKLNFRQGIVRHQSDTLGTPSFLDVSGGYVSLVVSPDPTIITFADGQKDYLYTERQSTSQAWGPFTPGPDYWLYWEINPVTGLRSFGHTTLEPVETATPPTSPGTGQMWFNTANTTMFEWNGAAWVPVIRVFACKLENGITPRSMSINSPAFTGTQVGITGSFKAGALAFDNFGKPIRTSDKKFFTTEDAFVTGVPTGSSINVSSILFPAVAQEPISAFTVVEFFDFNKIVHATPYSQGAKILGIIEEDVVTGEVVNFTIEGTIINTAWDWIGEGAEVNDPVYVDSTGLISLTPAIPNQLPIGVVTGRSEIIFSPRLFPQALLSVSAPSEFIDLADTPIDYAGFANQYVRVNSTETGLVFDTITHPTPTWGSITGTLSDQTDLQTELDNRSLVGHTHTESDVTDLDKYTRSEVDNLLITKSDVGHMHNIADVNGLQSALDTKVEDGVNVGTGIGLFHIKNGVNLEFKSLIAGANITLTDNGTDITVVATDTGEANDGANVGIPTGSPLPEYGTVYRDKVGPTLNFKTIVAGSNISITNNADSIVIDSTASGGSGLPASATEGDILVADNAGGWVENPIISTPQSYDLFMSYLGTPTASTTVHRWVATRDFTILNYGHQGNANNGGAATTPSGTTQDFDVQLNGASIGTIGFSQANPYVVPKITATAIVSPGVTGPIHHPVSAGDIVDIIAPGTVDPTIVDPTITLRAIELPPNPYGTLTVTAPASSTIDSFGIPWNISVTGSYTHIEITVIEISVDSGVNWQPMESGWANGGFPGDPVQINDGTTTVNLVTSSDVLITTSTNFTVASPGGSGYWYRIIAIAFGPAGISTAMTELITGGGN